MSERRVKVTPAEEYCPLAGEEHASIPANSKLPTPMEIKGDISQLPNVFDNVDSFPNTQGIHEKDVQKDHIAEPLSKRFNDTSPETLEDVTMENSYGIDYRSPSGSLQTYQDSTSPANQGRSVREFEEQMATLRKENFNLKLRLYFIEESIPGFQQTNSDGPETLMKQLIDTKFEMEILRKEIHEKQELLKEAAQAMNQMEKIQKETEAKGQAISEDLIRRIQMLEMEKQIEKSQDDEPVHDLIGQSDTSKNISAIQRIRELEDIVNESNEKLTDLQGQISKLDEILQKRDETVKEYEYKVKELVFQNAELLETLESKEKEVVCAELQRLREELQEQKSMLADKTCLLQEAEEQLKNRTQTHDKACRTIQKLVLSVTSLEDENKKLKNKIQASTETTKEAGKEAKNFSALSGLECSELSHTMSPAVTLKSEVLERQKQKYEAKIREQEAIIHNLQAEVKKKTANLQNLVNKELWEKNREIENLTKLVNAKGSSSPLSPIKDSTPHELQQSFTEIEYHKALERNKLLQKKVDILIQRLGVDRIHEELISQLRSDVREARENAEKAEIWRRQCADVCSILSNRLEELAHFLNSLLKHKDVLGMLAADRRKAMRKAVDRSLDLSKSLNMTLSITGVSINDQSLLQISNISDILGDLADTKNKTFNSHDELHAQVESSETLKAENKPLLEMKCCSLPLGCRESESEAWSEPDRNVSLARIGLDKHSASGTKNSATAVPPKVGAIETDSDSDVHCQSHSSIASLGASSRSLQRIVKLEQMVSQRDDRILDIQFQLADADSRLKMEHLKVTERTHEFDGLRHRNQELHSDLVAIGLEHNQGFYESIQTLQRQIEEKTRSLEKIQEERDRLLEEVRVYEIEIAALRTEKEDMKNKYEEALGLAQQHEREQLERLQTECKELLEARLVEQQRKHEDTLSREWIARTLYEESQQQVQNLQNRLTESQDLIEYLKENEEEMKRTIVSNELAMRDIKKQLDDSTMQASKAVLERTRAFNDKLQLEKCVEELNTQLQLKETQLSETESKVEQLQYARLTLQEQLDVAQVQVHNVCSSVVSQSGYTSEEVLKPNTAESSAGSNSVPQRLNNSSPDLGIESDAGRVHSVELSSAQHNCLKSVELHSRGKVDDTGATIEDAKSSIAPHDCAKVDQENLELRRKLIRTKRALEDTYDKLRISNQRRALVEKDIKSQILKTHNVLQNVRSNMENEL